MVEAVARAIEETLLACAAMKRSKASEWTHGPCLLAASAAITAIDAALSRPSPADGEVVEALKSLLAETEYEPGDHAIVPVKYQRLRDGCAEIIARHAHSLPVEAGVLERVREAQFVDHLRALLDMVDELYRKYGTELDDGDVAIAQAARNALLADLGDPA
jgi:hypothetical protein